MLTNPTHRGMVEYLIEGCGPPLDTRLTTPEEIEILVAMQDKKILSDIELSKLRQIWDAVCERDKAKIVHVHPKTISQKK